LPSSRIAVPVQTTSLIALEEHEHRVARVVLPNTIWPRSGLDAYFHSSERGSTVEREVRGGLATFFTIAYIAVFIPLILASPQDRAGAQSRRRAGIRPWRTRSLADAADQLDTQIKWRSIRAIVQTARQKEEAER
jgi:hypothetical protein